ncbi:MAG TPA: sigma-54-dependent Fis family transcriptional regulator [Gammaproteobacteria bacterium]|nr:sigma-54-dependent Fis family transcriptional regulator [Gammaproteobacteria bacterium]
MNQTSIAMIGESAELHNTLNAANIIAATPASVLILGESGTGKELIAQLLHQQSDRRHNPMISINCGALSETLVESELFGHKKGAFTGADHSRSGKLKSAHKSTLFLDEIGELPLSIQAKLLRFLESGECQTVGDETVTKLDVRIIAATNKDLHQCVAEGTFRADLYFRLNVIPLTLPPLRNRSTDIPLLIKHYSDFFADKYQLPNISFSKSAFKILSHYSWPGNVRELKNFTERMAILNSGKMIEAENLPSEFFSQSVQNANSTFTLPDNGIDLESLEINFINQALTKTAGNRSRAARLLGLSRDTLLYRLKKYSLC